jgi:hypothetical protein
MMVVFTTTTLWLLYLYWLSLNVYGVLTVNYLLNIDDIFVEILFIRHDFNKINKSKKCVWEIQNLQKII